MAAAEVVYPHTDDSTGWIVAAPPAAHNLVVITSVFSGFVWFFVSLVFVSLTVTIALLNFYSSTSLSFVSTFYLSLIHSWALFLDQYIPRRHTHFLYSLLLAICLGYCLVINTAYRSSLVTALTTETSGKWFDTPEEVIAAGQTAFIWKSGFTSFNDSAKTEEFWKTVLQPGRHAFIQNLVDSLREVANKRQGLLLCPVNYCFSLIRDSFMGSDMKPRLVFLKKRDNRFPVAFYMSPGSPLQPVMNERILWMVEGGLVVHWFHLIDHRTRLRIASKHRATKIPLEKNNGPRKLTVLHLKPVFFLLLASLPFTVCLFLVEIFFKHGCMYFFSHLGG